MNNITIRLLGIIAVPLLALCLPGNAVAGCLSNAATFTGTIGSQTSCADQNMSGVVIASGNTTNTYTGMSCDFTVTTTAPVGSTDYTAFSVAAKQGSTKPTCQVKNALTQGNQGANYCQNIYPFGVTSDHLVTTSDKGTPVTHKQLEVCTDEIATGQPRVQIEKRVTVVDDIGDPSDPSDDVFDCSIATDEIDVMAPVSVAYCYTITNIGMGVIDSLGLVDDMGVPGSVGTTVPLPVTSLAPSASTMASLVVEHLAEGLVENTATVAGTFEGALCSSCEDSDTAIVNVVTACDTTTQTLADTSGQVITSQGQAGVTRCGPKSTTGSTSFALLCDDSCDLKPECKADPTSCPQPCKPSKNWTYLEWDEVNGHSGACKYGEPGNDRLPLCAEVLSNPANALDSTGVPNCAAIKNPAFYRSNGHSNTYGRNPTILHFPSSGGGDSTGTIYCILDPGEDNVNPQVCPDGSFVY